MTYELYEILFISGASLLAVALVRFRDRQKRKAIEMACMKRMLASVCK
jgi:hypothetical protein